mmetsp:Transcript_23048/g.35656  ORF Transcript_23048/g.35656 Transcript_23048/m.35656 type:complete len:174 (+) Transcript_23048:318-839(+)
MKKKSTSKGGNIQLCVKSGVQNPNGKIGLMATDDEAYKTFGDLFAPVIKDLHPHFDFRYSYKAEEYKTESLIDMAREIEASVKRVTDFKIEVSRNFRGTPFTPLMTKEAKLQVERKVVEVLGDLYGSYKQVPKLEKAELDWLEENGVKIDSKQSELVAAGINDDWPVGRGVFI